MRTVPNTADESAQGADNLGIYFLISDNATGNRCTPIIGGELDAEEVGNKIRDDSSWYICVISSPIAAFG